jgi:hypothetical protein
MNILPFPRESNQTRKNLQTRTDNLGSRRRGDELRLPADPCTSETCPRERRQAALGGSGCRIGEFDCIIGQLPHRFAAPDTDHSCTGVKPASRLGAGHAVDIDTREQRASRIVD